MAGDGITGENTAIHVIVIILMLLSLISNAVLLMSILRSPTLLAATEVILNLNLTACDAAWSIIMLVTHIASFNEPVTIFTNPTVCTWQGFGLQTLAVASVFTLLAISGCNYWLIVMEKSHPTKKQLTMLLGVVWFVTLIWGLTPVLADRNDGYTIQPSGMYCGVNLLSQTPSAIIIRFLNMAILALLPCMIIAIYFFIGRKLWLVNKELIVVQHPSGSKGTGGSDTSGSSSTAGAMGDKSSSKSNPMLDASTASAQVGTAATDSSSKTGGKLSSQLRAKKSKNFQVQVAIIKRAVLVAGSFMGSWTFYLIINIMQSFSGKAVSPLTDARAVVFLPFSPLLNATVLLSLDRRYRESLMELLGLTNKKAEAQRAASSSTGRL
ncbi:hypothetical protein BC831DRAFT_477938 [Entophlyctis helioformis]|nr:hypothetical protein BC831DRAFT_477938 [Entophlyctis helioformis]